MNSNQRSEENNQSDNGGNELPVSSSRAGTLPGGDGEHNRARSPQQGGTAPGAAQSTDPSASPTGTRQQAEPGVHESNDLAGGLPRSPSAHRLAADQKMDDDTGLSNTVNRPPAEIIDEGSRQAEQSNVGRRSDGTPD